MSTTGLTLVAFLLAICVGLATSNPTADDYGRFILARIEEAVTRIDSNRPAPERERLAQFLSSQGRQLVESVIRPNTSRKDYGLFSVFETRLLDQRVVVLGVAHQFVPIQGTEETLRKFGSLVSTLAR